MPDSSWRDESLQPRGARGRDYEFAISLQEMHLLQRMRQLGAGAHAVVIVKSTRGRDGLESFRVRENVEDDVLRGA